MSVLHSKQIRRSFSCDRKMETSFVTSRQKKIVDRQCEPSTTKNNNSGFDTIFEGSSIVKKDRRVSEDGCYHGMPYISLAELCKSRKLTVVEQILLEKYKRNANENWPHRRPLRSEATSFSSNGSDDISDDEAQSTQNVHCSVSTADHQ